MKEEKYYKEITSIIENVEANSHIRRIINNTEKLQAYFEIGKLIVEAQGDESRAKYGDGLINKWSKKLTEKYGKNYSSRELRTMRKFYLFFPKWYSVSTISWTHYRYILTLKLETERNYYINQVILNNLSVRELIKEIKSDAFNRLSYADKNNIQLITNNNYNLKIEDILKDPIIIKIDKKYDKLNEIILHKYIIKMLENRFLELGLGFALIGHEYKINIEGHTFRIDLLFFNVKLNAYVVVEIKTRNMQIKDCDQVNFYTKLVDNHIKEPTNNKTIGLLIAKEKDSFIIKYATSKNIYLSTYKLEKIL